MSGNVYITHIVEFYPKEVFATIMDVYEDIQKDDTFESSLSRLFEVTYSVILIYCQTLHESPYRIVPSDDSILLQFAKLCEFLFDTATHVIINSNDINSRISALAIVQVLFGHAKCRERITE